VGQVLMFCLSVILDFCYPTNTIIVLPFVAPKAGFLKHC
jgi:hypothetical protein